MGRTIDPLDAVSTVVGLGVGKTSLSIDDLRWLRARARTHHGGNLSAAMNEGTQVLRHLDRMRALLDGLGAPQLTDAERTSIDQELATAHSARRKRKTSA